MNEASTKTTALRRQLFVHAGTHKTGTTAFQKLLEQEAADLRKSGIKILTPYLIRRSGSDSDSLAARCADYQKLILSHEAICTFPVERLSKLAESASPGQATYIIAFRYWPHWLFSRWAQSSLRRDSQSFHAYLENVMAEPYRLQDVAYHRIIQRARSAGFKAIRTISYDNATTDQSNSLMNILIDQCGLRGPLNQYGPRENITSGRLNDDIVRLFNGVRSEFEDNRQNALFEHVSLGVPIDCFYDQSPLIEKALRLDPALADDLSKIISETQREVRLEPSNFRELDERLEGEVGETAVNRVSGQFFVDKSPKSVLVSELAFSDLDAHLKKRMRRSLDKARQTKSTSSRVLSKFRAALNLQ